MAGWPCPQWEVLGWASAFMEAKHTLLGKGPDRHTATLLSRS